MIKVDVSRYSFPFPLVRWSTKGKGKLFSLVRPCHFEDAFSEFLKLDTVQDSGELDGLGPSQSQAQSDSVTHGRAW